MGTLTSLETLKAASVFKSLENTSTLLTLLASFETLRRISAITVPRLKTLQPSVS